MSLAGILLCEKARVTVASFLGTELQAVSKSITMAQKGYLEFGAVVEKEITQKIPDFPFPLFRTACFYIKEGQKKHIAIDLRRARLGIKETAVVDFRIKQLFYFIEWMFRKSSVVFDQILLDKTYVSVKCALATYQDTLHHRQITTLSLSKAHLTSNTLKWLIEAKTVHTFIADNSALLKNIETYTPFIEQQKINSSLEVLSLLDHKVQASKSTLVILSKLFTKLHTVYLSFQKASGLFGLEDPVMLARMEMPAFLKCGHVLDKNTWTQLQNKRCPTCRAESEDPVEICPRSIKVARTQDNIWKVELVDASKNPLTERVWTHLSCGELFNSPDFQEHDLLHQSCSACELKIEKKDLALLYLKSVQKEEPIDF
jgi:hypothetical protein